MSKVFLYSALLILTGCKPLLIAHNSLPGTNLSNTEKSNDCLSKSKISLEQRDVKQISLNSRAVTESGHLRPDQQLGYSFEAKTGETFNFHTPDNICVQLYSPSNQLLNESKLPEDGKYIAQVFLPKGSTSFKLEMSLESALSSKPSPRLESLAKRSTSDSVQPVEDDSSNISSPSRSIPEPAYSNTYEKVLDSMADNIFYEKHPELRGAKIQSSDTEISQEWKQIRTCDAVVDYVFYQRHHELNKRKIESTESDLRNEWFNIYRGVSSCT